MTKLTRGQTLHPFEALTGPQEELDVNVIDLNARVVVVTRRKCLRGSETHKPSHLKTLGTLRYSARQQPYVK